MLHNVKILYMCSNYPDRFYVGVDRFVVITLAVINFKCNYQKMCICYDYAIIVILEKVENIET